MLKSKSKEQNLFELEKNHATFKSETKTCHEQQKMQILSPLNEITNRMFLPSLIAGVVSKASFFPFTKESFFSINYSVCMVVSTLNTDTKGFNLIGSR